MAIKEYYYEKNSELKCHVCGDTENVVYDEDGNEICTDCLFEKECEEIF